VKALLRKRAVLDGLTEAQLAKISVARDQLAYEEKLEYHKHK